MPMLDALLSPADKARLLAAVPRRFSCRRYGSPLSLADWSALSFVAGRYRMPGVRLVLTRVDPALFTATLNGAGQIVNCTAVAAVIIEPGQLRSRVYAGILGEAFCLEATAMNLATCWQTDSYRERMLDLPLKSYEALCALIAVGHPAVTVQPPRDRKPLERICIGAPKLWPSQLQNAAEAIQQAPSLRNQQPWQLKLDRSRFVIALADHNAPEAGIAALHAELTIDYPHNWHFARGNWEEAVWTEAPGV